MGEIRSVAVIDALPRRTSVAGPVGNRIVDYFNLGVDEYRYPLGTAIGDEVRRIVEGLAGATGTKLTAVPYLDALVTIPDVQALLVVTGTEYDPSVDELVGLYRDDHYIDFVFV